MAETTPSRSPDVERQQRFQAIYEQNGWSGRVSKSGRGSDPENTHFVLKILASWFHELRPFVVMDLGCGDWVWMKDLPYHGHTYVGVDIVPSLIARNRELHGIAGKIEFVCMDAVGKALPEIDGVVLIRDVLPHLYLREISSVINNIRRSGATHLIGTTFPSVGLNRELRRQKWRPLNMEKPPFDLGEPISLVSENYRSPDGTLTDKSLGLWEVRP